MLWDGVFPVKDPDPYPKPRDRRDFLINLHPSGLVSSGRKDPLYPVLQMDRLPFHAMIECAHEDLR